MIKIGVADYGLNCWYGATYDYQDRFDLLKAAGYDGIERLEVSSAGDAVNIVADAKRNGLDFATCRGAKAMETLRWTAGLGMKYVWTDPVPLNQPFDDFCRKVNAQIEVSKKYGIEVGIHNHLGLLVETEEQLDEFMEKCPKCKLIFDTGHMAGAYGDPLRVLDKYYDKLVAVHLKDYVIKDAEAKIWHQRLRFCELGGGVMGDLNLDILKEIIKRGYDKWIFVEHDTHLQDPLIDLKISREFIRRAGI